MMVSLPYPEPPPPEQLQENDLAGLAAWDAAGMPPGPGESFAAYQQRLISCEQQLEAMEKVLAEEGGNSARTAFLEARATDIFNLSLDVPAPKGEDFTNKIFTQAE